MENNNLPAETGNKLPVERPDVSSPEFLILRAIEEKVPVEAMEKLLMMRRELREEKAKEAFFNALAQFQKECPVIEKGKQVFDKNGKPRYKYAPLDSIIAQVKDILESHGFSYTITTDQDKDSVTAICHAHHIAGYSKDSSFQIPIDKEAYMSAPQKIASALTYAKRYCFCDSFGIMTGDADDDAISAGETNNKPAGNKQPPKQNAGQNKPPINGQSVADIANNQLKLWVKEGWITEANVKGTIQAVAKKRQGEKVPQLKELLSLPNGKQMIEEIVKRCKKGVEMKKAAAGAGQPEPSQNQPVDFYDNTNFDPTPVQPPVGPGNYPPEDVKNAEFHEEDQK